MGEEIEKNTVDIFTKKLASIFKQLGDMLNSGLIKPITDLFIGIGNIFVQIFNILKELGDKIVSLPGCISTYLFKSIVDILNGFYSLLPQIIRKPISFIYNYTLGYIIDFLADASGYNENVQRCYGFNIGSQVKKINSNLTDINTSFKDSFGDINFSKIKI